MNYVSRSTDMDLGDFIAEPDAMYHGESALQP
jgi:hypothetical protein